MKVLITQSNYIPWIGYFDLIRSVDIFIIYDAMQYTKNDWRNRNLLRINGRINWLSVPCGKSISRSIDEVYPTNVQWNNQHWKTIEHAYKRSKYWDLLSENLRDTYLQLSNLSLSEININLIKFVMNHENIKTNIIHDTDLIAKEELLKLERTQRLVSLCSEVGCTTYVTAPAAKGYLDEDMFLRKNINVAFFEYPTYHKHPINGMTLDPELSWIDTCMNRGKLF